MTNAATRTQEVYQRLRMDILEGHLEPGSRLGFSALNKKYGASIGVLREALVRLAAEGFAVNNAQQGFKVISLSLEDLEDLTSTRCMIESLVLRDSIENGDLAWESALVAAHHRLERTEQYDPESPGLVTSAWASAHHDFHMALIDGAKSRRLKEISASLRASAEIYRRWSIPFEKSKRNIRSEHKKLMDSALARDAEKAVKVLNSHLQLTASLILDGVENTKKKMAAGKSG